jgi:hypothetical protein
VTSLWLFIFNEYVILPSKSNKQNKSRKQLFFAGHLEGH